MSEIQPSPEAADAGRRDIGHMMLLAVMEVALEKGGPDYMDNLMTLLPQELVAENKYLPSEPLLNTLDRMYPGAAEQVFARTDELYSEYVGLMLMDKPRRG